MIICSGLIHKIRHAFPVLIVISLLSLFLLSGKVQSQDSIDSSSKYFELSDSLYLQPELSLYYANKAIPLLKNENKIERYLYMLNSKSYLFQTLEEFDSMEVNNIFTLKEAKRLVETSNVAYTSALNNLARVYDIKGDLESAILLYEEALDNSLLDFSNDNFIGTLYENLGFLYMRQKDFGSAIEHLNKALFFHLRHFNIKMKDNNIGHPKIGKVKQFLASCYVSIGEYEKAQLLFLESYQEFEKLNVSSGQYLSFWYEEMAILKKEQGLLNEAENLLEIGLALEGLLPYQKSSLYLLLSQILTIRGNYKRAKVSLDRASHFAPNHLVRHMVNINLQYGEIYRNLGLFAVADSAYEEVSMILKSELPNTETEDFRHDDVFASQELSILYRDKGRLKKEEFDLNNSIEYLQKGLDSYVLMSNVLEELVISFYADDSKWHFLKKSREFIAEGMELAYQYYLIDEMAAWPYLLFFCEKNNSILLNSERFHRFKGNSSCQAEIRDLEKEIRSLMFIIKQFSSESDKSDSYRDQIFEKRRRLITSRTNCAVFKENISKSPSDIYEIQKDICEDGTTLLVYFRYDSILFTVVASNSRVDVFRSIDTSLELDLIEFKNMLVSKVDVSQSDGLNLLQRLAPVNYLDMKKALIVPDGEMNTLAFDQLFYLTLGEENSYLPIVSYCYSMVTLDHQFLRSVDKVSNSLFIQCDISEVNNKMSLYERDNLYALFDDHLLENESTKRNVISQLNASDLIHLSSHAIKGDIALGSNIELYDSVLYEYDIYNLNLTSQLTVLSGCESELGVYLPGEGTSSLGRAFTAAGSSAIVSSLWQINERSTADITISFYKYLKAGHSKSYALAQAKRDYLNSDIPEYKKHPYYWAGLILVGNDAPLKFENWYDTYLVPIVILLFFILSFIGYQRIVAHKIKVKDLRNAHGIGKNDFSDTVANIDCL